MIAWCLGAAVAAPSQWEALLEDYERFPEDYGVAVAVARQAGDAGLAAEAWARATQISGGNLETQLGSITSLAAAAR